MGRIEPEVVLFGAFDRHNFGDLLFPHVAAALLKERRLVYAGLAERDFRDCGGHRVEALAKLAGSLRDHPVEILHVGGEILTCEAWQAAVMLLPPEEVQAAVSRLELHPEERAEWAKNRLGLSSLAPYTLQRSLFPHASRIVYDAVGGVDLDTCEAGMRSEVLANLREADRVGVREKRTLGHLEKEGIDALLLPDPASMVAELFGEDILRAGRDEVERVLAAFPEGYVAVQFSADFGDDGTLAGIAEALDRVARATGLRTVLFRAGAAPWHDDLACYSRLASKMKLKPVAFESLHVWEICALIARSRAYCGSSLHGRIVAMAHAVPRIGLTRRDGPGKQEAYAATWEMRSMPIAAEPEEIASGIGKALSTDPEMRRKTAQDLAKIYRRGFDSLFGKQG